MQNNYRIATPPLLLLLAHYGLLLDPIIWFQISPLASVNRTGWIMLFVEAVLIVLLLARRQRTQWMVLLALDAVWLALHVGYAVLSPTSLTIVLALVAAARLAILFTSPIRALVATAQQRTRVS